MANQLEVNCYFKSGELGKLCEGTKDVVVKITVSFPPEEAPVFKVIADGLHDSKKESLAAQAAPPPPVPGCPYPCR